MDVKYSGSDREKEQGFSKLAYFNLPDCQTGMGEAEVSYLPWFLLFLGPKGDNLAAHLQGPTEMGSGKPTPRKEKGPKSGGVSQRK